MDRIYVDTDAQAQLLFDIQTVAANYRRTLEAVQVEAGREITRLTDGFATTALSHQTLNELVAEQARLSALTGAAVTLGISGDKIAAVTRSLEYVSVRVTGQDD